MPPQAALCKKILNEAVSQSLPHNYDTLRNNVVSVGAYDLHLPGEFLKSGSESSDKHVIILNSLFLITPDTGMIVPAPRNLGIYF